MKEREPQRNAGEQSLALGAGSLSYVAGHGPALQESPTERLVALRAELESALNKYRLGEYELALKALQKLIGDLAEVMTREPNAKPVRFALLRAAAHSALGRTWEQLDLDEPARAAFRQAVTLFDEWLPRVKHLTIQDYTEYAVALLREGRIPEAYASLDQALDVESPTPETYRALAETLEAMGRPEEAADNYIRSLLALTEVPVKEALATVERAVLLAPRNLQALSIKAEVHRQLGRHEEALKALDRVLEIDPGNSHALGSKGQVLGALQRYEEAALALKQAIDTDPALPGANAALGEMLRLLGRHEEALAALDQALKLEPENALALRTKGLVLGALQRYEEAALALKQAIDTDPALPGANAALGEMLRLLGRHEEALAALDQALKLEPDVANTLGIKGLVLVALQRYEEALEAVDRALELEPDVAYTLGIKGQVLRALTRDEEAVTTLRRAIDLDPSLTWIFGELGDTLRLLGHHQEALEALDDALTFDPDNAYILGAKGLVLGALARHEEATQVLHRAVTHRSDLAWCHTALGIELNYVSRYQDALDSFAIALQLDDTDILAWWGKGEALRFVGANEEALQAYNRALTLQPEDTGSLVGKGHALVALRRTVEALRAVRQAVKLQPDDAPILANLAYILRARGNVGRQSGGTAQTTTEQPERDDYEEALECLEKALALEPENVWALNIKGDVLSDLAEFQASAQVLDRATQLDPGDYSSWLSKGWALENIGAERAAEAKQAYEAALEHDPATDVVSELFYHKGIGNALRLLGKSVEAETKYRWVVEKAGRLTASDANTQSLVGWCQYQLGKYDEAIRLCIGVLAEAPEMTSVQFDMGLALLCSQRHGLALREYQHGLELAGRHGLGRRMLLYVARDDLRDAMNAHADLAQVDVVHRVLRMVESALEEAMRQRIGGV